MKNIAFAAAIILFATQFTSYATDAIQVNFTTDNWEIKAKESSIESYLGQPSLMIEEGKAYLKRVELQNGIIEYDVAFSAGRGFIGSSWHILDKKNYEEFYIRSHQSGNPDASQYTPVFNGLSGWQLYYGKAFSAQVKYNFDQWNHVKIVFMGKIVKIYINDMKKPAITALMKHPINSSGGIGFHTGLTKAHFANFSYRKLNEENSDDIPRHEPEKNSVNTWQVSQSFSEKSLNDVFLLTDQQKENLTWKKINVDWTIDPKSNRNIVNLARIQGVKKGANTAFAKFNVTSEIEQTKALKIGYSDRAKLYLNDRLLYGGNNMFLTRDYRYLGTIGDFDTVYLPLKKGHNEIWMAVSETFGGWGVMAKFASMDGITINQE